MYEPILLHDQLVLHHSTVSSHTGWLNEGLFRSESLLEFRIDRPDHQAALFVFEIDRFVGGVRYFIDLLRVQAVVVVIGERFEDPASCI